MGKKPKKEKKLAEIAKKKRQLYIIEKLHSKKALTKQEIAELEDFEKEPLPPTVVRTARDVAKIMDVALRTVHRWKEEGMPVTDEGFYDLEEIRAWYLRTRKYKKTEGREFWEEKIKKYQASILELRLKKETGELISREEVENGRVARVIAVRRAFMAVPTTMAPVLAMKEPREIEALLEEAIGDIIDEFAGVRKSINGTEDSEGRKQDVVGEGERRMETAGKDNNKPVG